MKHPYVDLPARQFWKKDPGISAGGLLDPVGEPAFQLSRTDKIVTAGSCFAQHVAAFLTRAGFDHHISEKAHAVIPKSLAHKHNYGMFSARYGNIYTARQLRQLLMRAFGQFTPVAEAWAHPSGDGVVDPFRPQIQPDGYCSAAEMLWDRAHHLSCVRSAIECMDVFVFTLGLTEAWRDKRDGAVFPLAPGVAGGVFDPGRYEFVNFDETETFEDLRASLDLIRGVNPNVRIILTVSPVPLNATYEKQHVLVSTTWSKAVLRICAEKAVKHFDACAYFPSYEIITSPHVRGAYFGADCREVTPAGVRHVMRLFLKHYGGEAGEAPPETAAPAAPTRTHLEEMEEMLDVLCDEEAIDDR